MKFYISVIIIILTLSIITVYQTRTPHTPVYYTKRVQQEYMKDLILTHFTETGVIKDQIHSNYWAYIPILGNSAFINPKMYIRKPNGATWIIQAKHGNALHEKMDSKISKLDLHNNVLIERLQTKEFVPILMKTEDVSYFPEQDFVESDKYVEMKKPGFTLSGIGLKGYLKTDTIKLLKNVNTNYETNT